MNTTLKTVALTAFVAAFSSAQAFDFSVSGLLQLNLVPVDKVSQAATSVPTFVPFNGNNIANLGSSLHGIRTIDSKNIPMLTYGKDRVEVDHPSSELRYSHVNVDFKQDDDNKLRLRFYGDGTIRVYGDVKMAPSADWTAMLHVEHTVSDGLGKTDAYNRDNYARLEHKSGLYIQGGFDNYFDRATVGLDNDFNTYMVDEAAASSKGIADIGGWFYSPLSTRMYGIEVGFKADNYSVEGHLVHDSQKTYSVITAAATPAPTVLDSIALTDSRRMGLGLSGTYTYQDLTVKGELQTLNVKPRKSYGGKELMISKGSAVTAMSIGAEYGYKVASIDGSAFFNFNSYVRKDKYDTAKMAKAVGATTAPAVAALSKFDSFKSKTTTMVLGTNVAFADKHEALVLYGMTNSNVDAPLFTFATVGTKTTVKSQPTTAGSDRAAKYKDSGLYLAYGYKLFDKDGSDAKVYAGFGQISRKVETKTPGSADSTTKAKGQSLILGLKAAF